MSLDITVHHFNVDSSPPPSMRLLEVARQLVDSATATSSKWHSIVPMHSVISLSSGTSKRACFIWRKAPPVIDGNLSMVDRKEELLDWNAPIEDNMEFIDLNSLPEFEGTDLQNIFLHPKSRFAKHTSQSDPISEYSAGDVDVNSDTRPRNLFFSKTGSIFPPPPAISISRLIPFPHYYESPDPARPPPLGLNNIPSFRVARSLTSLASLTTPFARTAWLVPLRGVPPVAGASSAQLYKTLLCELLPRDGSLSRTIMWTPAAITQFWAFLLRQRSTNNFGPIALAYMFSPPSNHNRQRNGRDGRGKGKGKEDDNYEGRERMHTEKRKRTLSLNAGCDEPAEISVWEYIKIYHDSQYAMKLRSLLDSFRLEEDTHGDRGETIGDMLPIHYRVLKTTRLVLVDETGEAILLA